MKSFFDFFITRPLLALVITISLLLLGGYGLSMVSIDIWPRVNFDQVIIKTHYTGHSAEDVELLITNEIESKIDELSGIKSYESTSMEGYSMINITLDETRSNQSVTNRIRENVTTSHLPSDLKNPPSVHVVTSKEFPIIAIGVAGGINEKERFYYAKQLKEKLDTLPEVARIMSHGFRKQEIHINVNPITLRQHHVSLQDIDRALKNRHIRVSSGPIDKPGTQHIILNSQFQNPQSLNQLIIRSNFNGKTIYLSDLASITNGFEKEFTRVHLNGKPAIAFEIIKKESAATLPTIRAIKQLIANEKASLSSSFELIVTNDMSVYLSRRLSVMISNGLIGIGFVLLILSLFLRKTIAFWVAMGLPVAISGILFLMPIFQQSINVVSLIAIILVIGIIVDDGIIVADSIVQKLEEGHPPKTAASLGIQAVFAPVITTLITTFLAFLPMFFMTGIMGKFIFCIPLTICFALLFSLLEVSTALPSHLASHLTPQHRPLISMTPAKNLYQRLLVPCLNWHKTSSCIAILLLILSGFLVVKQTRLELFSKQAAEAFILAIKYPKGTSLTENETKTRAIEATLLNLEKTDVIGMRTMIGSINSNSYDQLKQTNETEITVNLTPISKRNRTAADIIAALTPMMPDTVSFRIESGGPPVGRAISIEILHPNDTQRTHLADAVFACLTRIPGVIQLSRSDTGLSDNLIIDPNHLALSRLKIPAQIISDTLSIAYTGRISTHMRIDQENIPIRLQVAPIYQTQNSLNILPIPNTNGQLVPLSQLATMKKGVPIPNYKHYNSKRKISIHGEINEDKTLVADVIKTVNQTIDLSQWPEGQLLYTGQAEKHTESIKDLLKTFTLTIISMFILLVVLLNSIVQPLLILFCIPFGLISTGFAFILNNETLSFTALIGTIGLCGIVVNDALVMIHHLNKLTRANKHNNILLAKACADRFRPIILTSLTTVFGLLPLAYGFAGADPFLAPMALAIGWGLLLSTPLTLFILPCLYRTMSYFYKP